MMRHQGDQELDPRLREAVEGLPKSIDPPRDLWPGIRARIHEPAHAIRRSATVRESFRGNPAIRRWLPLAAAALLVIAVGVWRLTRPTAGAWAVRRLAGAPRVGDAAIGPAGTIRVGQWLVTDDSSRALIQVGDIGSVDVKPGTRLRLVRALPTDHRLALAHGSIYAKVDAPPRLFFVDTPAGTAVDLGCAYTLDVDSAGNGVLRVTQGYVEFDWGGRRSIVPLGALALIRRGAGPGTPYAADAGAALTDALHDLDFSGGGAAAVRRALAAARSEDALSVWHLLSRVPSELRPVVYDRLVALVPPPPGVARDAALRLDAATLERYWERIRRIAWRREILRGIREIDPRTGRGLAR